MSSTTERKTKGASRKARTTRSARAKAKPTSWVAGVKDAAESVVDKAKELVKGR